MSVAKPATAINKKAFIEALISERGIILKACAKSGVARRTVSTWMNNDAEFKEAFDQIDYDLAQIAEEALLKNVINLSEASTFFLLKKKGKYRGYGEVGPNDYLKLKGFDTAKTPEEKLGLVNEAVANSRISPAQAQALSNVVLNQVKVEMIINDVSDNLKLIMANLGIKKDAIPVGK